MYAHGHTLYLTLGQLNGFPIGTAHIRVVRFPPIDGHMSLSEIVMELGPVGNSAGKAHEVQCCIQPYGGH